MEIQKNKNLKSFTTFRIGGDAKFFAIASSIKDFQDAFHFAKNNNQKILVIGKGSNILLEDEGFDGLVIVNKFDKILLKDNLVEVGSGALIAKLAVLCQKNNLSGFEYAKALPASVGGAIFMNAACNSQKTSDNLISVMFLDEHSHLVEYFKDQLTFKYRYSSFQKMRGVILSAKFKLTKSDRVKELQESFVQKRNKTQPVRSYNAGCVFKNPKNMSAGYIIEKCGLKGKQVGGARVSDIHANFIVNDNNATSKDVLQLIHIIQNEVKNKMNIILEKEIRYIPK